MIRLHHSHETRSMRALWLLNELEVAFELIVWPFDKSLRSEDYLKLNPAGRVPALEIDGTGDLGKRRDHRGSVRPVFSERDGAGPGTCRTCGLADLAALCRDDQPAHSRSDPTAHRAIRRYHAQPDCDEAGSQTVGKDLQCRRGTAPDFGRLLAGKRVFGRGHRCRASGLHGPALCADRAIRNFGSLVRPRHGPARSAPARTARAAKPRVAPDGSERLPQKQAKTSGVSSQRSGAA